MASAKEMQSAIEEMPESVAPRLTPLQKSALVKISSGPQSPTSEMERRSYHALVEKEMAHVRESRSAGEVFSIAPLGEHQLEPKKKGRPTKLTGPYETFVNYFGGLHKVAELLGVSYITVYRTFRPKEERIRQPTKAMLFVVAKMAKDASLLDPFQTCERCSGMRNVYDEVTGQFIECPECTTTA